MNSKVVTLKTLVFAIFICLPCALYSQVPTITSFSPTSGPIGTSVTITGTNFDATPSNNIVFFGAIQAVVSLATTTTLDVVVPAGASYAPITVLTNGLITYSAEPFVVTYDGMALPGAKTDFTAGSQPSSVAAGDLDNDGKADLVVANKNSKSISIFRNNGANQGTISLQTKADHTAANKPVSVAIGDLDNDGKLDVAVADQSGNFVSIFRNASVDGSGVISFDTRTDIATAKTPKSVAIGDIDGDGFADLILAAQGDKLVAIHRNTSTGAGTIQFASREDLPAASQLQSVALGDFDGDGKLDISVAGKNTSLVAIYRNTSTVGDISFADKSQLLAGSSPSAVAVGDLDDDGKPDLAVTDATDDHIRLYKNTSTNIGTVSFGDLQVYITGEDPHSVAIGDLTGDGKLDLLVGYDNGTVSNISVFENTSTGSGVVSFNPTAKNHTSGTTPKSVGIVDLDNDGKVDIVSANSSSNTVSVMRSSSTETDFSTFSLAEQTGSATINTTSHTITIEVAYGTNVTELVPTFTLSDGATATVGGVTQESDVTSNDFTGDVTYEITAEDGSTKQNWSVTVDKALVSPDTDFITFSLPEEYTGASINTTDHTVEIKVPYGTNVTSLVPSFTLSTGATATVGTTTQESGTTSNDFTGTVVYKITAQNGIDTENWNVTVLEAIPSISSFSPSSGAPGTSVTITGTNFDPVPSGNTVFFGATQASVISSTSTELVVSVPSGATHAPVSVAVGGLIAYSSQPFVTTFTNSVFFSNDNRTDITIPNTSSMDSAIGDLDGDGKPDVVTLNNNTSVTVFRNTSTKTNINFSNALSITLTHTDPQAISIADVNADGKLDLVISNGGGVAVSVFINTSTGIGDISFINSVNVTTENSHRDLAVADFDKDGKVDLVLVQGDIFFVNKLKVIRNTSSGSTIAFDEIKSFDAAGIPNKVAVGDLDGDGLMDIVLADELGSDVISVFLNTSSDPGNINFATHLDFNTGIRPTALAISDFDGDNKPDVVVTNYDDSNVSVLLNTSTGDGNISFAGRQNFNVGSGPVDVAVSDLNGDGAVDVAVANSVGSSVSVLTNTSTGGGNINFAGKADYKPIGQPSSVIAADFDGDGLTDLATASNALSFFRSSENTDIIEFSLPQQTGAANIDPVNHEVTIEVSGADVTSLIPTFKLSSATATASVNSIQQTSGTTEVDFTNPVIYTISEGNISQDWKVTVESVAIVIDVVSADDYINASETGSDLIVSGSTQNIETGQPVTIKIVSTDGNNTEYYSNTSITIQSDGSWSVTVNATTLQTFPEGTHTIEVTSVNQAGISVTDTHDITVDTVAPTIAFDDGSSKVINAIEDNSDVTVTGTVSGAEDDQTVTVAINSKTYTAQVSGGIWHITIPQADVQNLADGTGYPATANVADAAGNPASQVTLTITRDTSVPAVGIDLIATDDVINITETASGVNISGISANVSGETVTVAITGTTISKSTAIKVDDTWEVSLITSELESLVAGTTYTVTADVAGANQASRTITRNTTVPTIAITASVSDGYINASDDDSDLIISGTSTDVEDGQTVIVQLSDGTISVTGTGGLISSDTWSATITASDLQSLAEGPISITADVSNAVGNAATQATANFIKDTIAPTVSFSVPTGADLLLFTDDLVNKRGVPKLGSSNVDGGTIVQLQFSELLLNSSISGGLIKTTDIEYQTSDDFRYTNTSTETIFEVRLNARDASPDKHGKVGTVFLEAASFQDLAGNSNAVSISFDMTYDMDAMPTFSVDGGIKNSNGVYETNAATVKVNITFPDYNPETGELVLIPFDGWTGFTLNNATIVDYTRRSEWVEGGSNNAFMTVKPTQEGTVTITFSDYVFSDDVWNNNLAFDFSFISDKTAPEIFINPIATDDIIDIFEAANGVAIDGTTANVENGQTVTLALNGNSYTTTVTDGAWSVTVPDITALSNGTYTVTAQVSDVAGNPAMAERNLVIDLIVLNTETDITAFSFLEQTGPAVMDATNHTVSVEVANGTDVGNLIATFTLSGGATAKVEGAAQESGTTPYDFTDPVTYTITAEDGSTTQDWLVNVSVAPNTETDITAFSFPEQSGPATIDAVNHKVEIEVAFDADISALVPTFTLSAGATVAVGTATQVSGTTANDFSSLVTYTVTAEDGSTMQDWTVTVTMELLVGIEDEINPIVTVYPNPVSSVVNIQSDRFRSATLHELSGRVILRSTQQQMDLSKIPGGVYVLVIETQSNERTKVRIIKE